MNDRNLVRGIFLVALSLLFGVPALVSYPIGDFSRAGPGLIQLLMSCLLLLVGIATIVRSRFTQPMKIAFSYKNVGLILGSLCAFALVSEFLNMTAGIVTMVFIATLAGSNYSIVRNLKIAAGLLAVAFSFEHFLGLNLPLY